MNHNMNFGSPAAYYGGGAGPGGGGENGGGAGQFMQFPPGQHGQQPMSPCYNMASSPYNCDQPGPAAGQPGSSPGAFGSQNSPYTTPGGQSSPFGGPGTPQQQQPGQPFSGSYQSGYFNSHSPQSGGGGGPYGPPASGSFGPMRHPSPNMAGGSGGGPIPHGLSSPGQMTGGVHAIKTDSSSDLKSPYGGAPGGTFSNFNNGFSGGGGGTGPMMSSGVFSQHPVMKKSDSVPGEFAPSSQYDYFSSQKAQTNRKKEDSSDSEAKEDDRNSSDKPQQQRDTKNEDSMPGEQQQSEDNNNSSNDNDDGGRNSVKSEEDALERLKEMTSSSRLLGNIGKDGNNSRAASKDSGFKSDMMESVNLDSIPELPDIPDLKFGKKEENDSKGGQPHPGMMPGCPDGSGIPMGGGHQSQEDFMHLQGE